MNRPAFALALATVAAVLWSAHAADARHAQRQRVRQRLREVMRAA